MAVTLPGRKASYTGRELARIVVWTGFRGTPAARAVSIILAESGGRTRAQNRNGPTRGCPNGSIDRGLAQINSCYHSEVSNTCAYDPYCNVSAMWRISDHGRNFHPWATFNSGAYQQFMNAAAEWVADVQQAGGVGPAIPTPIVGGGNPSTLSQAIDWVLGPLNWGPIGWLKDHIKAALMAAGRYVYDKLRPLIHDIGVAAHHGLHLLGVLRKWAQLGFHDLHIWAHEGFVAVRKWAQVGISNLYRWITARLGDAYAWVRKEIWAPLNRAYHGLLDWVKTTVIPFFKRELAALSHFLSRLKDFLLGLLADLKHWAEGAVRWLIDHVRAAVDWVAKFGAKVWGIIDKCWWFLVFVATHPLTWWQILLRDLAGRAPQMLGGLAAATMRTIGDDIERVIAKWLGG
ncbi:MAG TPA: hypothetical protein VIV12_01560 [Streptosporangiaceae bacterium]